MYEGGAMIWEGEICLIKYLAELTSTTELIDTPVSNQLSVLDIGCGQGIAGAYVLYHGFPISNDQRYV